MRYLFLCFLLLISACTDIEKNEIDNLLDARNTSISQKDIKAYASLLSQSYLQGSGKLAIQSMELTFDTFEKIEMVSRDRVIQINDENHSICEQTYVLKAYADKQWRNIVQREQLKFEREDGKWKINGGL